MIASIAWSFTLSFAIGELLGLTIRVTLNDGQTFEGTVVEESEATITLASKNEEITVRRDEIKTMRLLQQSTVVRTNVSETGRSDSLFAEERQAALRQVGLWKFFKDGFALGSSLVTASYAQSRATTDPLNLLIWYGGLGLGSFAVDLVLMPSVEARLLWPNCLSGMDSMAWPAAWQAWVAAYLWRLV